MDRLDSWLSRQVGWRRTAVNWVTVCPLAVGLGDALGDIFWPGTRFLEVAGLSVLAAIPFAGLVSTAQLRWQKRKPDTPSLSWRKAVSMWCLAGSLLTDMLLARQPYPRDGGLFLTGLVLFAVSFVFFVLAVHQQSKVRKSGWWWTGGSPG